MLHNDVSTQRPLLHGPCALEAGPISASEGPHVNDVWLVARCPSCSKCFGARDVAHRCPHCGHRTPTPMEVVDRATSASELQVKVTLANTPEELRDELRRRMGVPNPELRQRFQCFRDRCQCSATAASGSTSWAAIGRRRSTAASCDSACCQAFRLGASLSW